MAKIINQFCRNDGYNPSVKCDNPIQEKWIHKQIVKKVGDSEDDFIIEEIPVKVDEVNIQKSIQEEAKTTDLKYLLKQLILTGDESIIHQRDGFYGDITGVQSLVNGQPMVSADSLKATLPEELQILSAEAIAKMSDQEILDYIAKVRAVSSKEDVKVETPIESEVK